MTIINKERLNLKALISNSLYASWFELVPRERESKVGIFLRNHVDLKETNFSMVSLGRPCMGKLESSGSPSANPWAACLNNVMMMMMVFL